jgi:hypothetical protein
MVRDRTELALEANRAETDGSTLFPSKSCGASRSRLTFCLAKSVLKFRAVHVEMNDMQSVPPTHEYRAIGTE